MKRCNTIVLGVLSVVIGLGTSTPRVPPVPAVPYPVPGTTLAPAAQAASNGHRIDWYSLNGGGVSNATSVKHGVGATVGQSAAGEAISPSYQMGMGFWYGAGGCSCPKQGDINGDGVIDVFDVIGLIDIAFSGAPDPQDPLCPKTRGDADNNSVTDVFDVIYLIATAFSGGPNPVNPCGP